jgi:hypothetical protein
MLCCQKPDVIIFVFMGNRRPYTENIIKTNITGMIYGSQVAAAGMIKQGHGAIYSMEGLGSNNMIQPKTILYGTTKHALTYGVVFTPIVESIIHSFGNGVVGKGELVSFKILAFIFLIVCTAGGWFINNPPADYVPAGWNL